MLLSVPKAGVRSKEMLEGLPLNARTNEEPDGASTREVEGPKDSLFFSYFCFMAAPHSMQNFSSPTRDRNPHPLWLWVSEQELIHC